MTNKPKDPVHAPEEPDADIKEISKPEPQPVQAMIIPAKLMISFLSKIDLLPRGLTRALNDDITKIESIPVQNVNVTQQETEK